MMLYTSGRGKLVLFLLQLFLAIPLANAQSPTITSWTNSSVFRNDAFIVNGGQCKGGEAGDSIAFGVDNGFDQFQISATSLYACVLHKEEREKRFFHYNTKEKEEEENEKMENFFLRMHWLDANSSMTYESSEKRDDYFTYVLLDAASSPEKGIQVDGYRKIYGRDLYPGIDIEYRFVEGQSGIKYTLYIHPGADLSKLVLSYEGDVQKLSLLDDGSVRALLPEKEFIDSHAPLAWTEGSGENVACRYVIDGNKIHFIFPEGYDNTKTLVIDPWVVNSLPNMTTITNAFDVDYDNFGNLYIYGGYNTYKVAKYSPAGTLLWTFNGSVAAIGWSSYTFGPCSNFMVNRQNGKIYVGHTPMSANAKVIRLRTTGIYDNFVTSLPPSQFTEIWDMALDCSNNQLICFGGSPSGNNSVGRIDTALSSMNPTNITTFTQTNQDVVSGLIDKNGTVFLYLVSGFSAGGNNKIYRLTPTLNNNVWGTPSGYNNFTELTVSNKQYYAGLPGFVSNGFNCIAVNATYIFYYDGLNLKAFNKTTGVAVGTPLAIPGHLVMRQGGITADDCDNVYIGGVGQVLAYKFTGSVFTSLGTISLGAPLVAAHVYDVRYQQPTNSLYVCGQGFTGNFVATQSAACGILTTNTISNCNGSATTTVTNGPANPTITYTWYNSSNNVISTTTTGNLTNTVTGLTVGTYIVIIQVVSGCDLLTTSDTVTVGNGFIVTANPVVPVTCFGLSNGSATALPSLAGSYSYTWNTIPVQSTATANSLAAGTYVCTVTDLVSGCLSQVTVVITQPPAIVPASLISHVTCNGGNNGTATVTATGGTGPLTYSWNTSPVQNTSNATGLSAGNYNCTITDSTGCTLIQTITVNQPAVLTAAPSQVNVGCNGGNNGSATVVAAGGTGPYSYLWNTAPIQITPTATGLSPGNYSCTITDFWGCVVIQSFVISQPSALSVSDNIANVSCNGGSNGSASVTPSGGTGSYTYLWNTSPIQNTSTAAGLQAGNYICTVTDSLGCSAVDSVTITQPTPLAVNATFTNVSCNGGNTGNATANVSGGTGSYQYNWNTSPVQITATANNLTAGNYNCTVTDSLGCTVTQLVTITEPPLLTVVGSTTDEICFGGNSGQATATPFGGSGSYSYSWNTSPVQLTNTASTLTAGNYSCTVTDSLGCIITLNVTITEPPPMAVTSAVTNTSCANGSNGTASVNPTGGEAPYTFSWNTSPVQTTDTAIGLSAGNYSCVITDSLGCSVTQNVVIGQPAALSLVGVKTDARCFGEASGSISVTAGGGTGTYTFQWTPASAGNSTLADSLLAGNYSCTVTDSLGCTLTVNFAVGQPTAIALTAPPQLMCAGSAATLTAQALGGTGAFTYVWSPQGPNVSPAANTIYTVTATDANGCIDSATQVLTVSPLPVVNFTGDTLAGCMPHCVDFSDLSTASSPDTLSTWLWDFGDGNTSNTTSPTHCYTTSGFYTVSLLVTNNNGCTSSLTLNNMIEVYPLPQAAFTSGPQPTSILNPIISFTDLSVGAVQWQWYFNTTDLIGSTLQNPQYQYGDTGCFTVQLEVTNSYGCTSITQNDVCIDPDASIFVPNTFTPNGDGINDGFLPVGTGITDIDYHFMVFDRWGNLIWESKQWGEAWDGRANGGSQIAQIDTYVYKISCMDILGNHHSLIGHVNLIK